MRSVTKLACSTSVSFQVLIDADYAAPPLAWKLPLSMGYLRCKQSLERAQAFALATFAGACSHCLRRAGRLQDHSLDPCGHPRLPPWLLPVSGRQPSCSGQPMLAASPSNEPSSAGVIAARQRYGISSGASALHWRSQHQSAPTHGVGGLH